MKLKDISRNGKEGSTVVFAGRYGLVSRRRVIPTNPRTERQSEVRRHLAEQARRFGDLTDAQREAWNAAAATYRSHPRQGQSGPLTGLGVQDKIITRVGFHQAAFSNGLRYWSQNRPNCRFSSRQRMSRTFCAPETPQNMPDCLSLRPMTVLEPASTTPEPMNKPRARYSA